MGACVATGRNIVAVRARLAVAKRIGALHGRVVASQMSGKIGRARRTRGLTALEMELADSGDGTPLDRSDSEHAGAAARELRSPSSEHSSATQKLRMKLARKHRSLTDVEASQVERHASFIEKQHGHCEVLNTFTGPALVSYRWRRRNLGETKPVFGCGVGMPGARTHVSVDVEVSNRRRFSRGRLVSFAFVISNASHRYATDMRTLVRIVALDKVVGTAIEDMSAVGNFSQRHEAFFFNQLGLALPGLLDYALYADRDARRQLARTLSNLAAFDQTRRAAGAAPVADALIEAIDVPALIQWSVYAEECVGRAVSRPFDLPADRGGLVRRRGALGRGGDAVGRPPSPRRLGRGFSASPRRRPPPRRLGRDVADPARRPPPRRRRECPRDVSSPRPRRRSVAGTSCACSAWSSTA